MAQSGEEKSDIDKSDSSQGNFMEEICAGDALEDQSRDGKHDDPSRKVSEDSSPGVDEEASSSCVAFEKSMSSSKLNAEAPEFIPRVQALKTNSQVTGSILPDAGDQDVLTTEADLSGVSTSSSKAVLTEELIHKIVKQVEFYFSDTNLPTDKHLMKFVKKDPEGFVPIPVVASFRKVKGLVNNHALVGAALRTSSQLVVSDDGKKVRRVHPLPDIDIEEVQSRTVIVENLPNDYSIQNMEKIFGAVGKVNLVRVCHPQAPNGSSQVPTRFPKTDQIVSSKLHALVEYETVEQAEKAVSDLNDEGNWRSGLRVQLFLKRLGKYGHQTRGRKVDSVDVHGEGEDAVTSDAGNDKQLKVSAQHSERHYDFEGDEHHPNERNGGRRGRGRGRGRVRGRAQYYSNGRGHLAGAALSGNSNNTEVSAKQPPGPRMPDGTRGFTMGRGRPLADSTA